MKVSISLQTAKNTHQRTPSRSLWQAPSAPIPSLWTVFLPSPGTCRGREPFVSTAAEQWWAPGLAVNSPSLWSIQTVSVTRPEVRGAGKGAEYQAHLYFKKKKKERERERERERRGETNDVINRQILYYWGRWISTEVLVYIQPLPKGGQSYIGPQIRAIILNFKYEIFRIWKREREGGVRGDRRGGRISLSENRWSIHMIIM